MSIDQPGRRQQLSLLLAALLLLSNALVTAHAFGAEQHVAQDECSLLHQFERELDAPVSLPVPSFLAQPFAALRGDMLVVATSTSPVHFRSRAPPFA